MIEFLKNDVAAECFTFSVPPESETIESPQRVTETKTFGGSIFDEYGSDTVKINLSGSTVNEERKLIYRGNKRLPSYYTGEKEIFELQKIFYEWGRLDAIPDKKVYLYDLSKMSLLQMAAGSPARNYWRIINKNLRIRRTKDRPMTYQYDLEIIGVIDEPHKPAPLFSKGFTEVLDECQKAVEAVQAAYGQLEAAVDTIDSFMNGVVAARNAFESVRNAKSIEVVDTMFDRPLRIITGGSNRSIFNACKSLVAVGRKIQNLSGSSESRTRAGTNYSRNDAFIISFNSAQGPYTAPVKVPYGKTAVRPPDPLLPKYEFKGWFTDGSFRQEFDFTLEEITRNITLYAKWEQIQATVTFNSRQGTEVPRQTVDIGGTAAAPDPAPTRNGYEFEFWCGDSSSAIEFNFSDPITGDITLYARWRTVYTAKFNSNGGSDVESQMVNAGGKIIYPLTPARENYFFVMWCSDSGLNAAYDFNAPTVNNITLYAKWTRISNTVTFNSNGGTEVPRQTVDIGGYAVKPEDPVRDGYVFIQWCGDEGLNQEFIFNTTPIKYPTALYAKWEINIYTVDFDSGGGSDVERQEIPHGKLAVYPHIPEKDGAVFNRWCIDEGLTIEFNFSDPITGDITLYAAWYGGGDD
jgi:uncharacterized repeat protein (TIGR02543 family)